MDSRVIKGIMIKILKSGILYRGIYLVLLWPFALGAQQAPQYTLSLLNKYGFNPAYAGMDASLSVTGSFKTQWEGLPGKPSFQQLNAHMPVYIINGGAGFQLENDALGAEKTLGFTASYNYVYESPFGLFSFGLGLGILQKKLDGSLLRTPGGIYEGPTIEHNDPILSDETGTGIGPDLQAGVYFINDFIEAGISVQHALGNMISLNNANQTQFQLKRNYYLFAEYSYRIREDIDIYPGVLIKSDLIQTQTDLTLRAEYLSIYFGGLVIRGHSGNTFDAVGIIMGAKVSKQLTLGYAYDAPVSKLRKFTDGTHELLINYNLGEPIGLGRPEKIIYNPRH